MLRTLSPKPMDAELRDGEDAFKQENVTAQTPAPAFDAPFLNAGSTREETN